MPSPQYRSRVRPTITVGALTETTADEKRDDDATTTFTEMASSSLRWNKLVTHETLFDGANDYAAKQLELHARYADWTGLESLQASVADLQKRLESARNSGSCLLAIGWGAGFLSKSAAIGMDETEHRNVLAMMPFYERAIRSGLPFPKTRRVIFLKNKPAALPALVELSVL